MNQSVLDKPAKPELWWLLLLILLLPFMLVIPWFQHGILASPDETAVQLVATHLALHGQAWLNEPLLSAFPWLHARSFVSVGTRLVPVSFLAWPILLSPWRWLGASALPWIASLFVWSSLYPAYQLLRRWFSPLAVWLGTLVAYTTPALLLYANRSLFPNPALWAALLWGLWALATFRSERTWHWVILGAWLLGTIAIRPVEAFWVLPWIVWIGWENREQVKEQKWALLAGAVVALLSLFAFNTWVYGAPWTVGYWLHDAIATSQNGTASVATSKALVTRFFPFGIHPAHIWWNAKAFFGGILLPWILLLFASAGLFLAEKRRSWQTGGALIVLGWTAVSLWLFYGNGLYADHIRLGAIAVGNSFLRYLLPVAALVALAIAWLIDRYPKPAIRVTLIMIAVSLSLWGGYRAFFADEEGIWPTAHELRRYEGVRRQALELLPSQTVVLSERSDKIFFEPLRAVTPIPPMTEVHQLLEQTIPVAVFIRPPSQQERDTWAQAGIDLWLLQTFGRENLYQLRLRP